ncbi:MAG: hypothetical protein ACRDOO_25870 [Actinomadura sp.]
MRVELHIDRLVLDGTGVELRHAGIVREAVETELSRLLTGAPASSWRAWSSWQDRRMRRLTAPSVRLPAGQDAIAVGRLIARSVYGGVSASAASSGSKVTSRSAGSPATGGPR